MHRNISTRRHGFTLIELLVVIAVIALMMALLIGASYRFVVGARESATASTIMKASGLIQDRVRAFQEFDFSDAAIIGRDSWNLNNASPQIDAGLAEVLVRKTRFKKAFPQAFAELDAAQTTRFFGSSPLVFNSSYQPKYECGIVLYALLMKGETFGAASPGDDTFSGAEVKVGPETNNFPCLIDAWGEPIRFYRWPTRLIRCAEQDFNGDGNYDDYNLNGQQDTGGYGTAATRPNSMYPGPTPASLLISSLPPFDPAASYSVGPDGLPGRANWDDNLDGVNDDPGEIGWPDSDDPEYLNTDPDDPTFRLTGWLGPLTAQRRQFATGVSPQNALHDCFTFHSPLIVSSGPDKKLGLYEPTDVPTAANPTSLNFGYLAAPVFAPAGTSAAKTTMQDLYDDITNLNQRAGGR